MNWEWAMGFFSRLFGKPDDTGGPEPPSMPWDRRPSIFEYVRSHLVTDKPGLTGNASYTLPDEERIGRGSKIRWAAGAMDGVFSHHMEKGEDDDSVRKMVDLVVAYSRQPTAANKAIVYRHVIDAQVVSIIDPVIEALVKESGIKHGRLYEIARSFVTEAPDREPVKFGLAILGLFRQPEDEDLFLTLGRHDEFTLFCAVALTNSSDNADESLWTLARRVHGWGRIHVVERLAQTQNPAIKRWLLREGFRNWVMYEYLAATCARAGGLLAALSDDVADRDLLTGAGEIIQALITGGPAEGIDDYEDARPVIESYLAHMESSAGTIGDFLHVNSIKGYLDGDDVKWSARFENVWSSECRDRLRLACASILGRAEWPDKVKASLDSTDEMAFFDADLAAKALGLDTWAVHWRRLQEKPTESGRWYHVMALCNEDRIESVIDFAETHLDLKSIATGAADELGLGPAFQPHSCLGFILQDLHRFPRRGPGLIDAGLRSPVVSNRNQALSALAAWPRERWPSGLENTLSQAAKCEPDDGLRSRIENMLRGDSPSP
jgi:hypothetical protein